MILEVSICVDEMPCHTLAVLNADVVVAKVICARKLEPCNASPRCMPLVQPVNFRTWVGFEFQYEVGKVSLC